MNPSTPAFVPSNLTVDQNLPYLNKPNLNEPTEDELEASVLREIKMFEAGQGGGRLDSVDAKENFLIKLSLFKELGNPNPNSRLNPFALPPLEQTEEVFNCLNQRFDIVPESNLYPAAQATINDCLSAFIESIKKLSGVCVKDVLIIGGIADLLLQSAYWKQLFLANGCEESEYDSFFPPVPSLPKDRILNQRRDCDLLIEVDLANEQIIYKIKETIIQVLGRLVKQSAAVVKEQYFESLKVLHEEGNCLLIVKIGDRKETSVEIKIKFKAKLKCLFPSDAFGLSIFSSIEKQNDAIPVKCFARDPLRALFYRQTNQLWMEQPHQANFNVWPRFLAHLSINKECAQRTLNKILFFKTLVKHAELDDRIKLVKNCLEHHYPHDPLVALAVYFNLCVDEIGYLSKANKIDAMKKAISSLSFPNDSKSPPLLLAIHQALSKNPESIEELSILLRFCAAVFHQTNQSIPASSINQAMEAFIRPFLFEKNRQPSSTQESLALKLVVKHPIKPFSCTFWLPCKGKVELKKIKESLIKYPDFMACFYRPSLDKAPRSSKEISRLLYGELTDKALDEFLSDFNQPALSSYILDFISLNDHCKVSTRALINWMLLNLHPSNPELNHALIKKMEVFLIRHLKAPSDASLFPHLVKWNARSIPEEKASGPVYFLINDLLRMHGDYQINCLSLAVDVWKRTLDSSAILSLEENKQIVLQILNKLIDLNPMQALQFFNFTCRKISYEPDEALQLFSLIHGLVKNRESTHSHAKGLAFKLSEIDQLFDYLIVAQAKSQVDQASNGLLWMIESICQLDPLKADELLQRLDEQDWFTEKNAESYERTVLEVIENILRLSFVENLAKERWIQRLQAVSFSTLSDKRKELFGRVLLKLESSANGNEKRAVFDFISKLSPSDIKSLKKEDYESFKSHCLLVCESAEPKELEALLTAISSIVSLKDNLDFYKKTLEMCLKKTQGSLIDWAINALDQLGLVDLDFKIDYIEFLADRFFELNADYTFESLTKATFFIKKVNEKTPALKTQPQVKIYLLRLFLNQAFKTYQGLQTQQDKRAPVVFSIVEKNYFNDLLPVLNASQSVSIEDAKLACRLLEMKFSLLSVKTASWDAPDSLIVFIKTSSEEMKEIKFALLTLMFNRSASLSNLAAIQDEFGYLLRSASTPLLAYELAKKLKDKNLLSFFLTDCSKICKDLLDGRAYEQASQLMQSAFVFSNEALKTPFVDLLSPIAISRYKELTLKQLKSLERNELLMALKADSLSFEAFLEHQRIVIDQILALSSHDKIDRLNQWMKKIDSSDLLSDSTKKQIEKNAVDQLFSYAMELDKTIEIEAVDCLIQWTLKLKLEFDQNWLNLFKRCLKGEISFLAKFFGKLCLEEVIQQQKILCDSFIDFFDLAIKKKSPLIFQAIKNQAGLGFLKKLKAEEQEDFYANLLQSALKTPCKEETAVFYYLELYQAVDGIADRFQGKDIYSTYKRKLINVLIKTKQESYISQAGQELLYLLNESFLRSSIEASYRVSDKVSDWFKATYKTIVESLKIRLFKASKSKVAQTLQSPQIQGEINLFLELFTAGARWGLRVFASQIKDVIKVLMLSRSKISWIRENLEIFSLSLETLLDPSYEFDGEFLEEFSRLTSYCTIIGHVDGDIAKLYPDFSFTVTFFLKRLFDEKKVMHSNFKRYFLSSYQALNAYSLRAELSEVEIEAHVDFFAITIKNQ